MGAKVEEALLYHHAILQSLELLPLRYDTVFDLYKSTATWDNEPPGVPWNVQYANDSGLYLRYAINSRELEDAAGIKRYTPAAIMQIIKQHRERSTLWRALEQEIRTQRISRQKTAFTETPGRLVPVQLHLFAKIAIQEYFRQLQGAWESHLPEFIDESFKESKGSEDSKDNIVHLQAWRMHPERSK
jgi:hypothetical protein